MLFANAPPAYTSTAVRYPDGAVAEARAKCGVLDLCATITLPDGEIVRIYNRGAERCRPFYLHMVRTRGEVVLLESDLVTATTASGSAYSSPSPEPGPTPTPRPRHGPPPPPPPPGTHRGCPQFKNSYFTFDQGRIQMGVFLNKDGSLFVQFSAP